MCYYVEKARAVSAVERSSILDARLGFVRAMRAPEENEHRKKYNANYSLIIILLEARQSESRKYLL
jgi:hypothetical protein